MTHRTWPLIVACSLAFAVAGCDGETIVDSGVPTDAGPGVDTGMIMNDAGVDSGGVGVGCSVCDTNAACDISTGTAVCTCDAGYTGDGRTCIDLDECMASPPVCGTGTCANTDPGYTCTCGAGYMDDGTTCVDVDECVATPPVCGAGTCTNSVGSYGCMCPTGYTNDGTTCIDDDECAAMPTLCGLGTCVNVGGGYSCMCPAGYMDDGLTCVNIDECAATPPICGAGTCTDSVGSYSCACPAGYTDDGTTCVDDDECTMTPTVCGVGTCVNVDGSYTCTCPTGYMDDGATCVDTDECTVTPSICGAGTCVNATGTYSCNCPAGYMDDGTTCADIDECALTPTICGLGTCNNNAGGYTCTCPGGYEDDGTTCVDIDECTRGTDTCWANSVCINVPSGFDCQCYYGYTLGASVCTAPTILLLEPSGSSFQDAAATLGLNVIAATGGTWATLFDAGGFDAVVISLSGGWPQAEIEARIPTYITGGGKVIFAIWNLDASAPLRAALGVSTVEINNPINIYTDLSMVDLFTQQQTMNSPAVPDGVSTAGDNGDLLTLTGSGFIAGRFASPTGASSIVVTNGGSSIVNGFLFADFDGVNADGDATPDMEELAQNELNWLLSARLLVHESNISGANTADAVTGIGFSAGRTSSQAAFVSSMNAFAWDGVVIAIPTIGYGSTMEPRLLTHISGGGRVNFSYFGLDSATAMQTALGVSTVSFNAAPTIMAETVPLEANFFDLVEVTTSPIVGADTVPDNGDRLTITGAGYSAARFSTGETATAVTNSRRTIVNGFLTRDLRGADVDGDSIPDILEVYRNQLHYQYAGL